MNLIMPDTDYVKNGYWKNINLYSFLQENEKKFGDRVAYIDSKVKVTYSELVYKIKKMAGALKEDGIQAGDVVSFQLPNWVEAIVIYKAIQMIGAIANPITPIYRKKELEYILSHSKAKMIFIPYKFRNHNYLNMIRELDYYSNLQKVIVLDYYKDLPRLNEKESNYTTFINSGGINEDIHPVDEKTIALIIFTSGTTSQPKGVLMSHNTLKAQVDRYQSVYNLTKDETMFVLGSFGHVSGLNVGVEIPLCVGCKTVHQDIWNPKQAIELMIDHEVTWGLGATPFLKGLVTEYNKLPKERQEKLRLNTFLCGGADIPPDLIYAAQKTFNCFVGRTYGSSEGGTITLPSYDDPDHKAATTEGKLNDFKLIKILDENKKELPPGKAGEVAVKGPDLFLGYLQPEFNLDSFTEDGYFLTGDIGVIDEDQYLEIIARKKDIIVRGGENISVKEVEDLLYKHPSISSVAIVGMPDEVMGERACAYVVLNQGKEFTLKEMIEYLENENIAKQKIPERLEIIDKMPINANGKIQKFKLKEDIKKKVSGVSKL